MHRRAESFLTPDMVFTELMDLKKKWEEDKAKVEKLKESRKFKPY